MKKIALSVFLILLSGAYIQADDGNGSYDHRHQTSNNTKQSVTNREALMHQPKVSKQYINEDKNKHRRQAVFVYEPNLGPEKYTYIIELLPPSVLEKPELRRSLYRSRSDFRQYKKNPDLKNHVTYLQQYQQEFIHSLGGKDNVSLVSQYEYVLNGMALRLTQAQAQQIANHEKVKKITRETIFYTNTDQGPTLIGAPPLWLGDIGSSLPTQGEGVVVGIIDSGINSDHPSFAEVSGDGYVHTNPRGDGVYLGDCAGQFPELCNNKLIGVYSYSNITNSYTDTDVFPPNLPANGEDYDGHGSHVAATAVGNVLNNLPETLPTEGQIESDGTATGFTFAQISGVAPRANLISYQVCFVGRADQDDTYAGCPGSAINRGIEDAIKDGVDVINFSISGGGDPWRDSTESAFLRAQSVGIFVATSAGNSGSDASSSEKHSPWYTSVAASEHGRQNAFVKQIDNFIGGLSTPTAITGQSNTGRISGNIVYAGNFSNPNDPTNDSAQCLQPFPANTFNGQIVVCDRGEIARVEKAENVQAGGAGGYVLANLQGEETFLANDQYVVPGIHINADDGDRLKQWLASGSNHRVTITAGEPSQNIDIARVDVLASFSSRGPNTTISTLTPTMTAPGVDIYAAYADQRFGHDGHEAPAGDFNYLSGTSMSSPHVAGAAALLKSLNPGWTPDNIRSALAMTATTSVTRQDAATTADFFDMGSGRIRVDLAAQVGLLLDETEAAYLAAEPALGGEPRSLNLPSITDNECIGVCTWSRTFTATKDGVWDARGETTEDGLSISVSPQTFSIQAGQTQTISVTVDTINAAKNRYIFGNLVLSADNSTQLHLPISVLSSIGDIPTSINTNATRDSDSLLIEDIEAVSLNSFLLSPVSLVRATIVNGQVSEDSNPFDYLDNPTDGVVLTEVTVPENAKRIIAEIVSSSAEDLDLYLIFDRNDDGMPSRFEEVAQSLSGNSVEEIQIDYPQAGRYFIAIQNFIGSSDQPDNYQMRYAVVGPEQDDSLQVEAPSSLQEDLPFDMRLFYQLENAQIGDDYYGAIELGTSTSTPANLGLITVDITRENNDVSLTGNPARVDVGDSAPLNITIAGNTTNEDRTYALAVANVAGAEFSNVGDGTITANGLQYVINKVSGDTSTTNLSFDLNITQTNAPGPIVVLLSSELQNRSRDTFQQALPFIQVQVEGPPSIDFNGNPSTVLNVFERQSITIPINTSDPNQDDVTLRFTQTQGPASDISQSDGLATLSAPDVESDTVLRFDVEADDGNGNSVVSQFTVNVLNNEPPTIESISAPSNASGGQRITITVTTSDPESDNLTVIIDGVEGNTLSRNTPRTGTSISYFISVSDGINTVTDTVIVNLNQAPVNTGSSGGGGSMPVFWLFLLMLISIWRGFIKATDTQ